MARSKNTNPCVTIEVAGRGEFPIDMLRYDQCAPADGAAASAIAHACDPEKRVRVDWDAPIRLNCYKHGGPTPGRWLSFMWSVREVV